MFLILHVTPIELTLFFSHEKKIATVAPVSSLLRCSCRYVLQAFWTWFCDTLAQFGLTSFAQFEV